LALVFILIVSTILCLFLVQKEQERGGLNESSLFQGRNWSNFMLRSIGSDGTIYATGIPVGSYNLNNLPGNLAIYPNGTLRWFAPTNVMIVVTPGADGGFYYVDWVERKYWENDNSQQGFRNLTALDGDGNFRWSFVMNGTLDLWAAYPDGTVIVHHLASSFDQIAQEWVNQANEIVAVSSNGSELWRMNTPLPDYSYNHPRVASNGTLLLTASSQNQTFQVGISEDGSQVFIEERTVYFPDDYGSFSPDGLVQYSCTREGVDNETTVTGIRATNASDGTLHWRYILEYGDNPFHHYQVSQVVFTRVDAKGAIYCNDAQWDFTYCLDKNGTLLWKKQCFGGLWATYSSGGFLAHRESTMQKVSSSGSVLWQYPVGSLYSVLMDANETIYYSTGSSVYVLASSPDNNQVIIIGLFLAIDIIVVLVFASGYYRSRKEQDGEDG
jgi:hypothetical protein